MSFIVKDLAYEIDTLVSKGADLLNSNDECAVIDVRKDGNIIIRLLQT